MHTLPRRDRTFTSGDLIRFWCRNLDSDEQAEVVLFFVFIAAPLLQNLILNFIERIFEIVPVPGASRRLLRAFNTVLRTVGRIPVRVLARSFDPDTFEVIVDCLEEL